MYTRQWRVTRGLASPATAPPSLRTPRGGGGGAAAGCLHRPAALRHLPPVLGPPPPSLRRGRHRAVPNGAAGPGTTGARRAPFPPLTSGGSPGRGFPPDVSAGREPPLAGGRGAAAGARRDRRLSRGSREAAAAAPPHTRLRSGGETFPRRGPRTPRRASLRGGTTSHGAQSPTPRRHGEPQRFPSPFHLPSARCCCFPGRREGAPQPPRPGSRPLCSAASSGRAALAARCSSASRFGCITPLI